MAVIAHRSPTPSPTIASRWIAANAGSGKTYNLTRHVVRLLLLGVPPERIYCITYTKAAAGEMRQRMVALLRELLLCDDASCHEKVAAIVGEPPDAAMLARARTLFGQVIDSEAGGVVLTTIHGFCQTILRAFPLEAGIAPHFTVAEEAQTAELIAQVRHRLLTSPLAVEGALADAIALLAQRSGEMQFGKLVQAILQRRERWDVLRQLNREHFRAGLARLVGWEGGDLQALEQAALSCLSAAQRDALRQALPGWQRDKAAYKRTLGERGAAWLEGAISIDAWLDLWLTQKFTPRANLQKGEFAPGSALGDLSQHCIAAAERYCEQRAVLALFEETAAAATIAQQLLELYEQLKHERGVLDYQDLITRTRQLLTLRDMAGWVMSKLDHRIDHLLVDEAQDTSSEQWEIVQALVNELVATTGGVGSDGLARSLFVVGDEKQSIFSFQGAAPQLYMAKEAHFAQLLQHTAAPLQPDALTVSYRSTPAILALADAVATEPAIAAALSAHAAPQSHQVGRAAKDGAPLAGQVVLHAPLPVEEKTEAEPFVMPVEYAITRSGAQLLAEHVARHVKQWIDAGAWGAGDILILTRNRHPIVLPLLRALQRHSVAVAGLDRLVLADHLAVRDLLALMDWLSDAQDDLALAQVLRSPLIGWSEEQLFDLAHGRGGIALWSVLQQNHSPVREALQRWCTLAPSTPYDFLTHVLEVGGARRRFAERFGGEVHEILDELKEQAASMPAHATPSIAQFAVQLRESDRQIKRELDSGAGQVRVMTVHGAKGLEAPLVLLVDTVGLPSTGKELFHDQADMQGQLFPLLALSEDARHAQRWREARSAHDAAQLAEYYRLLYVAITRPREALHVFAATPVRGAMRPECWYEALRRGLELLPGTRPAADGGLIYEDAGFAPAATTAPTADPAPIPAWATTQVTPVPRAATLNPSRLAPAALEPFRPGKGDDGRERGVRLHRALQYFTADTDREQLRALLTQLAPDWTHDAQDAAAQELWQLYQNHSWLWQHARRVEVNINGALELEGVRYPVSGQIDLLIDTPEALVVVDYKTGHAVQGTEEISLSYRLQLKLYVALLRTLYPGRTVRAAIVWTANARLQWLDEAVDATPWPVAHLDASVAEPYLSPQQPM